ncbi:MAG: hypothetical protein R3194_12110, partial [Limnobacter sp.]|nr:hypothetical protein [Limnobacter sp.]
MIKRMVLCVKAGLHADLQLNEMVVGTIRPGQLFECPVHEFLVDGENLFTLKANLETRRSLQVDTPVWFRLELRHGQPFSRENGRQTVLEKKVVVPKGPVLRGSNIVELKQRIPAGFPQWQFLSSLKCEAGATDRAMAEAFLYELDFEIRQKNLEFVCAAFSHRNQELAAAYGLTEYESNQRFRQYMSAFLEQLDDSESDKQAQSVELHQLSQTPV